MQRVELSERQFGQIEKWVEERGGEIDKIMVSRDHGCETTVWKVRRERLVTHKEPPIFDGRSYYCPRDLECSDIVLRDLVEVEILRLPEEPKQGVTTS